jgi:trehalose synthase
MLVRPLPAAALEPVVGAQRYAQLLAAAGVFRDRLGRRTIWNVSSAAVGGGVAEMLQVLVGYAAGLDISIRWSVIKGDPDFFSITKRLHNQIHGTISGAGMLGSADAGHYERVLAANADELLGQVRPGDIALLHDPQTAGLTAPLVRAGVRVIWRCHIGLDIHNDTTHAAWDFLRTYLAPAHGYVFTRQQYVPSWMHGARVWIIPPSIDPFSAKNVELDAAAVRAILTTIGVLSGDGPEGGGAAGAQRPEGRGCLARRDGTVGTVTRAGVVIGTGRPGPADPVVVQVSRWDRLKDPAGVIRGFADHVAPGGPGFLLLAGPAVCGVADDPESAEVFAECVAQCDSLPAAIRDRVLLAALPLDDVEENAAMINAIQRHATVIVQKSIAEGFGLTVAEGMWKRRPVVGSAVGGIRNQIVDGTGVLLSDPTDLAAFGSAVRWLIDHPDAADRMGTAGQEFVREHYLADRHLLRYGELISSLMGD